MRNDAGWGQCRRLWAGSDYVRMLVAMASELRVLNRGTRALRRLTQNCEENYKIRFFVVTTFYPIEISYGYHFVLHAECTSFCLKNNINLVGVTKLRANELRAIRIMYFPVEHKIAFTMGS